MPVIIHPLFKPLPKVRSGGTCQDDLLKRAPEASYDLMQSTGTIPFQEIGRVWPKILTARIYDMISDDWMVSEQLYNSLFRQIQANSSP